MMNTIIRQNHRLPVSHFQFSQSRRPYRLTLIENCNAYNFFIKWTPGKEHFQKEENISCCIINEQKMFAIERFIGADLFI